jgi:hypothetical protein
MPQRNGNYLAVTLGGPASTPGREVILPGQAPGRPVASATAKGLCRRLIISHILGDAFHTVAGTVASDRCLTQTRCAPSSLAWLPVVAGMLLKFHDQHFKRLACLKRCMRNFLGAIPALIGVVVGVVATSWTDRVCGLRSQTVRWDERRVDACADYARAVKRIHMIALGITVSLNPHSRLQ